MTAPTDIDELERLLEKATPGPWAIRRGDSVVEIRTVAGLEIAATRGDRYWEHFSDEALANAETITTLHNAAPELIAEVRRLREALEDMTSHCFACDGQGSMSTMDETEINQSPGSSAQPCPYCSRGRQALNPTPPEVGQE